MIRNMMTPTISSILDVKALRRDGAGSFIVDTVSDAKVDYNDPALYFSIINGNARAVEVVIGSLDTNTLITNDGLIGVFRATNVLEVIDIFEADLVTTYQDILPIGYAELASYTEVNNPVNKRLFIVRDKNTDGVLWTRNTLEFTDILGYHFSSQMDYALETDEYGFYITTAGLWASTYEETSDFQFLKKSFFKFEGTGTITVALKDEDNAIQLDNLTNGLYGLRYLDIDSAGLNDPDSDIFINFIISSDSDYGYIAIY